ncbi:LTA synthase family protein [uncultured Dubosiella sp.]|uniref:LTA synthase family protein n=2 Tax=uncultured Dubosiella sp. TaxID=1937011 RepID=UPI0025926C5A|nr:LTA synthase family protein [uncultured Dubosiella sp.]
MEKLMKNILTNQKMQSVWKVIKWIFLILTNLLICLFVFAGLGFKEACVWVPEKFGNIPFEQILFTINTSVNGAGEGVMSEVWEACLKQPLLCAMSLLVFLFCFNTLFIYFKKNLLRRISLFLIFILSFAVFWDGFNDFSKQIGFYEYLNAYMHPSTLYEDYYVDPASLEYMFPEKKRNLIYIYLESMETSYADQEHGGALEESLIPELTKLATNKNTFTSGKGYTVLPSNGWTAASLVASTSGANLKTPIAQDDTDVEYQFMPGAYTLGQILEKEGYNQALLIGSDGSFGQRDLYFSQHGNYQIEDYYYAKEIEWIPENYRVWWGYEDKKLFDFAKEELLRLSKESEPFNFTMLTADTHFFDGALCPDCEHTYPDQYSNVIRCSSKRIGKFIQWVKKQDFYENTTIVIAGDHLTMDDEWALEHFGTDYQRKAYYTIINSPAEKQKDEDRELTAFDFYPTILTSLGVQYNGDRVGLGTNLYGTTPTLAEQLGSDELENQLKQFSIYYQEKILKSSK